MYLSTYQSMYPSMYLSTYLAIYLCIFVSIYVSTYLSIYLSIIYLSPIYYLLIESFSNYFIFSFLNHLMLLLKFRVLMHKPMISYPWYCVPCYKYANAYSLVVLFKAQVISYFVPNLNYTFYHLLLICLTFSSENSTFLGNAFL